MSFQTEYKSLILHTEQKAYSYSQHEFNNIQIARYTLNSDQEQAWNYKHTSDSYGGNYRTLIECLP